MSDLSALLNPAPSPGGATQATSLEHQNSRRETAKRLPPVRTEGPAVQPSIKSPLETLAEAATSSAPLLSPSNPAGTQFMSFGSYHPTNSKSSSRPSSSRISPPLTYDPHAPVPTSPSFSPGLQQYHHPSSSEVQARRLSETAESSARTLAPFRSSLHGVNEPNSETLNLQSHSESNDQTTLPGMGAANMSEGEGKASADENNEQLSSQITQSSPGPSIPVYSSNLLPTQSEQVEVKTEINETAPDVASAPIQTPKNTFESSEPTKRETPVPPIVAEMKIKSSPAPSNHSNQGPPLKPKPAPSRKRAAPKKGTAKPAAKKRKIDALESIENASLPRYGTPASSRASKTPAPRNRKQDSMTPQRSSSVTNEDDDDEGGTFCICRGPDNHTWMIACDGPCEDWFHGRCINMTEKEGDLIEKYFCPNCTAAGEGQTLWKRMCRLNGCIRPARATGPHKSKYCSDDHGVEFMRRAIARSGGPQKSSTTSTTATSPKKRTQRQTNNSASLAELTPESSPTAAGAPANEQEKTPNTPLHLRGGVLRAAEVKSLVTGVNTQAEFRKLGEPLPDPSTDGANGTAPNGVPDSTSKITYTPSESAQLTSIAQKRAELQSRKEMLDDREIFIRLVKDRAKAVLDEMRKKETIKDICGYDNRLAWSDEEFNQWCLSPEGRKTLETRKLGPPPVPLVIEDKVPAVNGIVPTGLPDGTGKDIPTTNGDTISPIKDKDTPMVNGDHPSSSSLTNGHVENEEDGDFARGVCPKKRCGRHALGMPWAKLQDREMAFERDGVRRGMRELEKEEKGVKDRAMLRWLEGEGEGLS